VNDDPASREAIVEVWHPGPIRPIDRLNRALCECQLSAQASADLSCWASKIDHAIHQFGTFVVLESVTEGKARKQWLQLVSQHAIRLADLLANPPHLAGSKLANDFACDAFEAYGLLSPFELEPMMRALAAAAEQVMTRPKFGRAECGEPAAQKEEGRSPMRRLIWKLAGAYRNVTGDDARITRANSAGDKGGPFFNFVCAVASQWNFRPPSAEAVALALRSN